MREKAPATETPMHFGDWETTAYMDDRGLWVEVAYEEEGQQHAQRALVGQVIGWKPGAVIHLDELTDAIREAETALTDVCMQQRMWRRDPANRAAVLRQRIGRNRAMWDFLRRLREPHPDVVAELDRLIDRDETELAKLDSPPAPPP